MLRWPRPERGFNVAERDVPPIRSRKNFLGEDNSGGRIPSSRFDRDRISTTAISKSVRSCLLPFARGSQSAVEEFGGGAVGADPIAPAEQVVNFVGED